MSHNHLAKRLSAPKLWALMVGMVISGQYFGWSYGMGVSASLFNFFIAVALVVVFYVCLTLCCAELAIMMPMSGGPSVYAEHAYGKVVGVSVGVACLLEFFCAVPAIAVSLGDYLHLLLPAFSARSFSLLAVLIVLVFNCFRVDNMARIEFIATILALLGLIIFYCVGVAHVAIYRFDAVSGGVSIVGVMRAIPFAIWLFLAIEGGVMTAEEMHDPKHTILKGFASALLTLVICTILTVCITAAISGHHAAETDSPLPAALLQLQGAVPAFAAKVVAVFGLFGLFASLNGITMAYSRQLYSLAERGYMPRIFSRLSANDVPVFATVLPGALVLILVVMSNTAMTLVTLSVLGAVLMYGWIFLSLLRLRKRGAENMGSIKVVKPIMILGVLLSWLFLVAIAISLVTQVS